MDQRVGSERLARGGSTPTPARSKQEGVTAIFRKTKQVYRIAFSYRGVQCRETVDLPHSKANETYCARLRAEILGKIARNEFVYGDYFPDSPRLVTFGEKEAVTRKVTDFLLKTILEDYRDRVEKTLEPSTFKAYRTDINNILIPWCGEMDVREFSKRDIREWVGLQTSTLKRIRNLVLPLRNVLSEAVDDEVIKSNPFVGLDLSKLVAPDQRTTDYEPHPYTTAELVTLLGRMSGVERWTFQFWAFTGLRTGELTGLRWFRIDRKLRQVVVQETTTAGKDKVRPKTPSGVRTIPLLPAAWEAVEGMMEITFARGDRFTYNPRGRRDDPFWDTNKLADVWTRAHRGTGIVARNPYQLRHTFASQLLSQGENIAHIAKLLGHKDIEMVTRTYGKWVAEGEKLGFDRPPRRYGMSPLWSGASV